MTKIEALETIKSVLTESLDYFEYFDENPNEDEHADLYWNIKDVISSIDKKMKE
nr:MAG TPA: hypothetical protein [Caudoviricetes sp.]